MEESSAKSLAPGPDPYSDSNSILERVTVDPLAKFDWDSESRSAPDSD